MFLVFVLYVKRWVCQPLLFSISFCFIRYEVGLCNPFNIFLLLFYMLRCGYVKPFIYFLVFGFICYQVGM